MVKSDQGSLEYLLEQQVVPPEYQKSLAKLMGFDFEIQYKSGHSNEVADALSHLPLIENLGLSFVK